jgi:hypothetical protein
MEGKSVNVYDTYANALAHAATGLSTIYEMAPLTGLQSTEITQVAKTTGLTADQNGMVHFFVEAGTYYLMSAGLWGPPRKVIIA